MAGHPGRRRIAAAVTLWSAPLGCCVGPSGDDDNASLETSTSTAASTTMVDDDWLQIFSDPAVLKDLLLDDPTIKSNHPGYPDNITAVRVGVRVAHLFGIDTRHKTYRVAGTLQVEWHDPRLDFSGSQVSGFDHLEWDSDDIWTPQIYMQDAVVDDSQDTYEFLRSLNNGTVRLDRVINLQIMCSTMHFEAYPWDTQSCTMTFVPLKASAAQVSLEFFPQSGMTGIEDLSLGEWHQFTTSWTSGATEAWHFNQRVLWPWAKGTFEMQRITWGRLYNMVLPSVLMTIMSYSGFWINPAAAPARIGLAMIAVLATITHRASVMAVLPVVSYLVWIDVYITINLAFNVVAVLCYALVNFGLQCEAAEKRAEDAARKKSDGEDRSADGHAAHPPGHDGGDPDMTEDGLDAAHHEPRAARRGLRRKGACKMRLSSLVHVDVIMRVVYPICYVILNAYMLGTVWDRVLLL